MIKAHASQVRKVDDSPYVVHPITVALTVAKYGFSETVIAAALVHDVLEDTNYPEPQLRDELGDNILQIVLSLTENKSQVWEERKTKYIETIRNASTEVKAVSIADKIHNLNSILTGYNQLGFVIWEKFTRGREQQQWFATQILTSYNHNWHHQLVDEYATLLEQMQRLA